MLLPNNPNVGPRVVWVAASGNERWPGWPGTQASAIWDWYGRTPWPGGHTTFTLTHQHPQPNPTPRPAFHGELVFANGPLQAAQSGGPFTLSERNQDRFYRVSPLVNGVSSLPAGALIGLHITRDTDGKNVTMIWYYQGTEPLTYLWGPSPDADAVRTLTFQSVDIPSSIGPGVGVRREESTLAVLTG